MADTEANDGDAAEGAWTVSEVNRHIEGTLGGESLLSSGVPCFGEVVNANLHRSGLYFSLTDGDATLRCILWRSRYDDLEFEIEDGMELLVFGPVEYFVPKGTVSLKPTAVRAIGEGARLAAIERLKRDLAERGWFDGDRKRPLPRYPERVGVLTSAEGDARHDVAESIEARYPGMTVVHRHAGVQGDRAPDELAAGIGALDGRVDVIVLSRGGGSETDLDAFNTETVAAAIVACGTPVVAAVGHREDVTIADRCADASAITPTAAGELVVPTKADELARIREIETAAASAFAGLVRSRLDSLRADLDRAAAALERERERRLERVRALDRRLEAAFRTFARGRLGERRQALEAAYERLERTRSHERETRAAVERARTEASVPTAYKAALAVLALLVVFLLAVVLL